MYSWLEVTQLNNSHQPTSVTQLPTYTSWWALTQLACMLSSYITTDLQASEGSSLAVVALWPTGIKPQGSISILQCTANGSMHTDTNIPSILVPQLEWLALAHRGDMYEYSRWSSPGVFLKVIKAERTISKISVINTTNITSLQTRKLSMPQNQKVVLSNLNYTFIAR